MEINKIFYISPRDVRKNRADAVHIMLSCQAFSKYDLDVELVTPTVQRNEYIINKDSIFELYDIQKPNFKVTELNTVISEVPNNETKPYGIVLTKFRNFWSFGYKNKKVLRSKKTIIYSKCYISTVPFILLKMIGLITSPIVFEAITPKNSLLHRFVYRYSNKIISHLKYVTDDIVKFSNVSKEKIFIPPYFTQIEELKNITESKKELRRELGLNHDDFIVLYAGKAGDKVKQVWYFIECAVHLSSLKFLIVGANSKGEAAFNKFKAENNLQNLEIRSFQPLKSYYKYVKASDILVGYYPATAHNKYHLSPGKAGIYFASKNPCVFSDLPSLRSLFPDDSVFYAKPDAPDKLAESIKFIRKNPTIAMKKAKNAYDFASVSTYDNFAKSILNFISVAD